MVCWLLEYHALYGRLLKELVRRVVQYNFKLADTFWCMANVSGNWKFPDFGKFYILSPKFYNKPISEYKCPLIRGVLFRVSIN